MSTPNRFYCRAALLVGVLLLSTGFAANADEIQDANKLFKQGQHGQALEKVNAYLAGKPKDAQARFLKGLILTEQGNANDAIKIFSGLTEDYPELPEPYNNLAVLHASKGQYDKAKQALEMAIRTHPSYSTAHENLGDIYAKMASQAYDRALQLDRSNTATQTKLAMIQDLFSGAPRSKRPAPVVTSKADAVAPAKPPETKQETRPEPKSAPTATAVAPAKPVEPAKSSEPAPAKPGSDEVIRTVKTWAAAWAAQDVKKYLSFYAPDFKTPDGQSRADWESLRRERINGPASIQVGISNVSVSFSGNNLATVKFHQTYRASHMKAVGNKTLVMVNSGGKWLIREERTK